MKVLKFIFEVAYFIFDAIKAEWLAMGLFLAGQSYTMKQVKTLFNENRISA